MEGVEQRTEIRTLNALRLIGTAARKGEGPGEPPPRSALAAVIRHRDELVTADTVV
jgi:hypothetical protein